MILKIAIVISTEDGGLIHKELNVRLVEVGNEDAKRENTKENEERKRENTKEEKEGKLVEDNFISIVKYNIYRIII